MRGPRNALAIVGLAVSLTLGGLQTGAMACAAEGADADRPAAAAEMPAAERRMGLDHGHRAAAETSIVQILTSVAEPPPAPALFLQRYWSSAG